MAEPDLDEDEMMPAGHRIPDDLLPATIDARGPERPLPETPKFAWQVPIEPTPLPVDVDERTALVDHINDDLETYNVILRNLRQQWKGPTLTCIDDVCKLSLTTMKIIEARRRAANKPLGSKGDGGDKGSIIEVD